MLLRREILSALGAIPAASVLGPGALYAQAAAKLPRRVLGRTGFPVVPYALGGIGMGAAGTDGTFQALWSGPVERPVRLRVAPTRSIYPLVAPYLPQSLLGWSGRDRLGIRVIRMPPTVSQIAYHHATDIDSEKQIDATKLASLCNIAAERAKDGIRANLPGYLDLQRFILAEIINSMQITHRTIVTVLMECEGKPESVDSLALARVQLEGLYNFCLMLEKPSFVDDYLKDAWKKQYIAVLLQTVETKALPRFDEYSRALAPRFLEDGRLLYGITEAERMTIDYEQLGTPLPPGMNPQRLSRFPTPGTAIQKVAPGDRRRMLERLHPEYVELSSFAHALPHSSLLKGLLDPRSLHRKLFSDSQAKHTGIKDVRERAFVVSLLSIAQCAAEVVEHRPDDINLIAGVTEAWKVFSEDSLLGKTIWEIRTRKLLGIIV